VFFFKDIQNAFRLEGYLMDGPKILSYNLSFKKRLMSFAAGGGVWIPSTEHGVLGFAMEFMANLPSDFPTDNEAKQDPLNTTEHFNGVAQLLWGLCDTLSVSLATSDIVAAFNTTTTISPTVSVQELTSSNSASPVHDINNSVVSCTVSVQELTSSNSASPDTVASPVHDINNSVVSCTVSGQALTSSNSASPVLPVQELANTEAANVVFRDVNSPACTQFVAGYKPKSLKMCCFPDCMFLPKQRTGLIICHGCFSSGCGFEARYCDKHLKDHNDHLENVDRMQFPDVLSRCNQETKTFYGIVDSKSLRSVSHYLTLASISPQNFMVPFKPSLHMTILQQVLDFKKEEEAANG
jgi:hypothetical protein